MIKPCRILSTSPCFLAQSPFVYVHALYKLIHFLLSQCNDFLVWHQLLVDVGNDIFRVVYLDTSQQALLYDPSITAVDLNISSKYSSYS